MIYRYWCDECQNEYEIEPINEPVEDIKPKCCTMCKAPLVDDSVSQTRRSYE